MKAGCREAPPGSRPRQAHSRSRGPSNGRTAQGNTAHEATDTRRSKDEHGPRHAQSALKRQEQGGQSAAPQNGRPSRPDSSGRGNASKRGRGKSKDEGRPSRPLGGRGQDPMHAPTLPESLQRTMLGQSQGGPGRVRAPGRQATALPIHPNAPQQLGAHGGGDVPRPKLRPMRAAAVPGTAQHPHRVQHRQAEEQPQPAQRGSRGKPRRRPQSQQVPRRRRGALARKRRPHAPDPHPHRGDHGAEDEGVP